MWGGILEVPGTIVLWRSLAPRAEPKRRKNVLTFAISAFTHGKKGRVGGGCSEWVRVLLRPRGEDRGRGGMEEGEVGMGRPGTT